MPVVFKDNVVNKASFSKHENNERVNYNMKDAGICVIS